MNFHFGHWENAIIIRACLLLYCDVLSGTATLASSRSILKVLTSFVMLQYRRERGMV